MSTTVKIAEIVSSLLDMIHQRNIQIISGLITSILALSLLLTHQPKQAFSPSWAKLALREVGDKLLRAQNDFNSLVLPVTEKAPNQFVLTLKTPVALHPDSLVHFTQTSFKKAQLPNNYLLEVLACNTQKVVYSYAVQQTTGNNIVPCKGRTLPKNCYRIETMFTIPQKSNTATIMYYTLLVFGIVLFAIGWRNKKALQPITNTLKSDNTTNYTALGSFQFYPEQNKLVKQAEEISLSKKECELLSIFIEKPNQIIKREELSKKVWEDQGVIVGRSLDTYISKLRKKLKADTNIKLTNVHGVGYKLEIS